MSILITLFLRGRLNRKIRVVKFFCPKCEEYTSRPRNRPNCPNCKGVMYPVRYCPKCRIDDTVISLTQWRCYQCGSKLREIANIIKAEEEQDKIVD